LARPLGRLRPGELLAVDSGESQQRDTICFIRREGELALVELSRDEILHERGVIPLPPYIRTELSNSDRYQTVYALEEGSAAAPTAGLHFTPKLLSACRDRGVDITAVTLHVGLDTFRPIIEERFEDHRMHSEWLRVPAEAARSIAEARADGRRVIAVGTTVTRALETVAREIDTATSIEGRTTLFIRPPYDFRLVAGLITNFHLPRTTLLLMVGAFAGTELLARAYEHAISERYRFYSFGDAMLIV
jgi:S-adenosylmethionine:tRNA ribosyltransferase-isomerase